MDFTMLKLRLMQNGAIFTPAARKLMPKDKFGHFNFGDYATTSGMIFELDNFVYANVPIRFNKTPFSVGVNEGKFVLLEKSDGENTILPVALKILPQPRFALENERLEDGTPVRELVMTHGDRTRISPVHGCAFHCQFCTCNMQYYMEIPVSRLDQAVQIALNDPYIRPRHFLISGGTPREEEASFAYIDEIYKYFPRKYSKYEFDIMLAPRGRKISQQNSAGYEDYLKYLHEECGVKTLSVNLELYNERFRRDYVSDKWSIGTENYLLFIEKAVKIFGDRKIRSSILVGIENKEDTLAGVERLAAIGCLPVLSAFVAAPATQMAQHTEPKAEYLYEIVQEAHEIALRYGLVLGPLCRHCTHNSLTYEG